MDTQRHRQWPTRGVTTYQLHIIVIEEFKQAIAEGFKPGFIDVRQCERQRQPRRIGSHRRQIAQIHRQRFPGEIGGINVGEEVVACHQRIGADRQRLFFRDVQKCAIVTNTGFDIKTRRSYAVKITGNQGKLAACHTLCLSRKKRKSRGQRKQVPPSSRPRDYFLLGRITGAALSSTPFTNLWLSSAPKVFASSIASLMATLYGTSLRLDSSNSAIRSTAFST